MQKYVHLVLGYSKTDAQKPMNGYSKTDAQKPMNGYSKTDAQKPMNGYSKTDERLFKNRWVGVASGSG